MKNIKIGLLGFGNVGAGTYKALELNKEQIENDFGIQIEVSKILVNSLDKKRLYEAPKELFTLDYNDIIGNPEIDIVVEVLGGIEPATTYMIKALEKGHHVVTANKAAVAHNFNKLNDLAKKNHLKFSVEACVAGGIPIINAITTVLKSNQFTEILGILNGTTNYILTKMSQFNLPYDEVLKDAQNKGFAEADPTADVEGIDAANKLSILIALAFNQYVHPDNIDTTGISKITAEDIKKATSENKVIKLIASATKKDDVLNYSVKPVALDNTHPLARVDNEFNAVFIKGNAVDELMFYGKGAGPLPTGSAVLGDILQIAKFIAVHKK